MHAVDLHGDGWGDDLYLAVQHHDGGEDRRLSESSEPVYYSLNCACKVIRLFSESGDMTISMYRNGTEFVPFEWEALFAVGYSDGVSTESFDLYGGTDSEIVIDDWNVISSTQTFNINADAPKNKCIPPPPKPTHVTASADDASNSTGDGTAKPKPPPLVNVRLTLMESEGNAWCDDSGASHEITCSKEHHFSPDATIPNILMYPRYFISDAEGRKLMQQGTMRGDAEEDVREVKLPREGAYVFSVSGDYLSETGTLSWDFCGEQGGINERLHFNMVHGVCKPHYIEVLDSELSCDGEWSTGSLFDTHPIEPLSASSKLSAMRFALHIGLAVGAVVGVVALVMLVLGSRRKRPSMKNVEFSRLDVTEHI